MRALTIKLWWCLLYILDMLHTLGGNGKVLSKSRTLVTGKGKTWHWVIPCQWCTRLGRHKGSWGSPPMKDEMPLIAPREAATVQLPSWSNQKPGSPWKLMAVEEFSRVLRPTLYDLMCSLLVSESLAVPNMFEFMNKLIDDYCFYCCDPWLLFHFQLVLHSNCPAWFQAAKVGMHHSW